MVLNDKQAEAVAKKLSGVSQQYLGRNLSYLGCVPRDPHVSQAVMQTQPFYLRYPNAMATKSIESIARRLVSQRAASEGPAAGFFKRFARNLGLVSNG
jgi:flagellar biosynthesis protein FlhG